MTSLVLTNNAQSKLATALASAATQLTVEAGQGPLFPIPGANEWFPLTIVKADGSGSEIVHASSRSGDQIEVVRAREGTTALTFSSGDYVLHQMTAAAHLDLANRSSDVAQTSAGTSSAYTVTLSEVSTLNAGLAFSYVAHLTNVGNATLKVGTLAAKPLRKYAFDGSDTIEALGAGEILQGRQVLVHYDSTNGVFIVSNPNRKEEAIASDSQAGVVMLASDPQTFDEDGDNVKTVTQKTASQIAQGAVDKYAEEVADGNLPYIWRDFGKGSGGVLQILSASSAALQAGRVAQFEEVIVNQGGTLNISRRGVAVILCSTKFVLNGTLELSEGSVALPHAIGPTGNVHSQHAGAWPDLNTLPALHPGDTQFASNLAAANPGTRVDRETVEAAILTGANMQQFQGGNGGAYRENYLGGNRGGLIIIAPEIEIGPTAVVNNMHPEDEKNFAGGTVQQGPGGGGMIVLVSEAITRDPSAVFEAAEESTAGTTDNHRTALQLSADADFVTGAGNGQLFEVNRNTGTVIMVF